MERNARRFTQNMLLLHVALLGVVVGVVYVAAREVYASFRSEAIHAARQRQELLAVQTGGAIESYYASILSNLDLLQRSELTPWLSGDASTAPATTQQTGVRAWTLSPALWAQLKDRASQLLVIDRPTLGVWRSFSDSPDVSMDAIIQSNGQWLRGVTDRAISPAQFIDGREVNLVCVAAGEGRRLLLVAVVPVSEVESKFLMKLNDPARNITAMLVDGAGRMMAMSRRLEATSSPSGRRMIPDMSSLMKRYEARGEQGTTTFQTSTALSSDQPGEAMTTIHPIHIVGQTWWVTVSSGLSWVDGVIQHLFRRAFWWTVFVIVSVTTILVSTFIAIIRSRLKLERMHHEMLAKEMEQAREIQLAWLPAQYQSVGNLDIAAINHPASHISGDFYNWFELADGRVVVSIGDVTGHGMSGAFLMATTQLLSRMTMMHVEDPGRALTEVNRQLCIQMFNGQFVTMLILVIDADNQELSIATAGHYPPLMGHAGDFVSLEVEPQLVLGVEKDIKYPTQRFRLPPSATLLLYTDGVLDAQSPAGERFSNENLVAALKGPFPSAKSVITRIVQVLTDYRGSRDLPDDLTMVAIQLRNKPG